MFILRATIDGFALAEAARWADTGVAESVAHVVRGLFLVVVITMFGVTPIVLGAGLRSSDNYPDWLGVASITGGTVGVIAATMIFLSGFTTLAYHVLFTISSMLFTLSVGLTGYLLWRQTPRPAPPREAASTAP